MAKWHHTTIYLGTGETHSCYHPAPHKIPLDEIVIDASALHNTNQKKHERLEMLNGGKPSGCNYCWNIEAMGDDYISDRKERNSTIYTDKRFQQIKDGDWDQNINPQYIEISFATSVILNVDIAIPSTAVLTTKRSKITVLTLWLRIIVTILTGFKYTKKKLVPMWRHGGVGGLKFVRH